MPIDTTRALARERTPSLLLLGPALLLAASCGGSGGGSGAGGGGAGFVDAEITGEDGGGFAPPVADGTTVAVLEAPATSAPSLLLHGTFPIPPGTFPRADGRAPFTVLDYDGSPRPTQTELVSRYAGAEQGADVVEVIARVNVDPSLPQGARTRYAVVQQPQAAPLPATQATVGDLLDGPALVHPEVAALLADPKAVEVTARDCFGNEYVAHPLNGAGWLRRERYGSQHTELRVYQDLLPNPTIAGPQGTLPHFLGLHAYVSTFNQEEFLGFDVRFHNAHSGNDASSPLDDPLDRVYFERIEVRVPAGWRLLQDFDDPYFGSFVDDAEGRTYSLVAPDPDGTMHVIRWQGQFLRRLALATEAGVPAARERLTGVGQAFCVEGEELWSWWNRGTARYFPQNYQLPSLTHVGIDDVRTELREAHDALIGHLKNGTNVGDYPVLAGTLGWGHPYGVPYGGMTGGNEIFRFDGVSTAASGSIRGLRLYQAIHRMHTDRQPSALYDLDGEPSSIEDWLVDSGGPYDYVPFNHFLLPKLEPGDPFGFDQAPQFQIDYVADNDLKPAYEDAHLSFDPHDYQHFVRYTRAPKVLAWLANDSLAKDDLRMQAECFHLSYHPHYNNGSGGYQSSGMRAHMEFVASYGGRGFPFGRGEAWGADTMVAAYALADPEWRAHKLPWFQNLARVLADGQGDCVGFLQAQVSGKFVDGKYRARQAIESSITEHMLQGLRETVFRGADQTRSESVGRVLLRSVLASTSDMAWFPGESAPWSHTGVGPKAESSRNWCNRGQMPDDAFTPVYERYLIWSSLAYGYELTGSESFLERARQLGGNPDLLQYLQNQGTDNLENRASILALVQRLE